jgi:hypothetical protein
VHDLTVPDSARDDAGASLAQSDDLLASRRLQDHVDRSGEQDQDLIAPRVHLPMAGAPCHPGGTQQATLVKVGSMRDLAPELLVDVDDLCGAVVRKVAA